MGESITEGTVAAVLKSPGESVAADEVIAQIETDKVTIDVRAPSSGKVSSLEVKEGETVVVGQVVAKVEEGVGAVVHGEDAHAVRVRRAGLVEHVDVLHVAVGGRPLLSPPAECPLSVGRAPRGSAPSSGRWRAPRRFL